MHSKLRRSHSFTFKNKRNISSVGEDIVELRKNLDKSIKIGTALFQENQQLKKELEVVKENQKLYENIRSEIQNRRKLYEMEKENLETQIYELRVELKEFRNENEILTKENDRTMRDLQLTRSQLNRVVENNSALRKEKKINKSLFRKLGEKMLSRRSSCNVETRKKAFEVGVKSNSYACLPNTKTKSPPTPSSDESYVIQKRNRSLSRQKKRKNRDIQVQKKRIIKNMKMMKDSVMDIKKELYQANLWFSQTRFEGCRFLKTINKRKEEERRVVSALKDRVEELEKKISEKDMKHARQVEKFIQMFNINSIYCKG